MFVYSLDINLITHGMTQARDLPKILVAGYGLIPYFIFDAQEGESLNLLHIAFCQLTMSASPNILHLRCNAGSRSTLFAASDPQVPEYCETLKSEDWPVCACINYDCNPMNASEEAHNLDTSHLVWEKTLEMIGLPSDALEKLIAGEPVQCRYGAEKSE
jgi:hypothetical protein